MKNAGLWGGEVLVKDKRAVFIHEMLYFLALFEVAPAAVGAKKV